MISSPVPYVARPFGHPIAAFDFSNPIRLNRCGVNSASYAFTAIRYVVSAILTRQGDRIGAIQVARGPKAA
jgi:hypothetical protein